VLPPIVDWYRCIAVSSRIDCVRVSWFAFAPRAVPVARWSARPPDRGVVDRSGRHWVSF